MKLQTKLIFGPEAEQKKQSAHLLQQKEALKVFPGKVSVKSNQ